MEFLYRFYNTEFCLFDIVFHLEMQLCSTQAASSPYIVKFAKLVLPFKSREFYFIGRFVTNIVCVIFGSKYFNGSLSKNSFVWNCFLMWFFC